MHDNARQPEQARRRVFGFPEFIPAVEAEYPRFFEVGPLVLTAMHSVADREYPAVEQHQRAILNLAMIASSSLVEVVIMAVNGLGHGGMRILRSLLEIAINIEYFRLHPESFEDYRLWVHVERFREFEFLRQHVPVVYAGIEPETIEQVRKEMARVRARFLMRDTSGKSRGLRSGWSSLNLDARAVATGFTEAYQTINPLASGFIHETMYGMLRHFDAARDLHRVEVPPTLDWTAQALSGAHHCMVRVVSTLGQTFGVAPEPNVAALEADWRHAWTEPREDAIVQQPQADGQAEPEPQQS